MLGEGSEGGKGDHGWEREREKESQLSLHLSHSLPLFFFFFLLSFSSFILLIFLPSFPLLFHLFLSVSIFTDNLSAQSNEIYFCFLSSISTVDSYYQMDIKYFKPDSDRLPSDTRHPSQPSVPIYSYPLSSSFLFFPFCHSLHLFSISQSTHTQYSFCASPSPSSPLSHLPFSPSSPLLLLPPLQLEPLSYLRSNVYFLLLRIFSSLHFLLLLWVGSREKSVREWIQIHLPSTNHTYLSCTDLFTSLTLYLMYLIELSFFFSSLHCDQTHESIVSLSIHV